MTREEACKAAEVMLAYANGKEIEGLDRRSGKYKQITSPAFNWMNYPDCYRIKPKPKYRPFASREELEKEMVKHQPYGQIIEACYLNRFCIVGITTDNSIRVKHYSNILENGYEASFSEAFDKFTFPDDTPFGIEEGGEE